MFSIHSMVPITMWFRPMAVGLLHHTRMSLEPVLQKHCAARRGENESAATHLSCRVVRTHFNFGKVPVRKAQDLIYMYQNPTRSDDSLNGRATTISNNCLPTSWNPDRCDAMTLTHAPCLHCAAKLTRVFMNNQD